MEGIDFKPVELDEQACSYDTDRFIIFYGDIMVKLWIGPPFSLFQVDILNAVRVCPSQLTWNAWAFILCFEVIYLWLNLEPLAKAFLFFFTHA